MNKLINFDYLSEFFKAHQLNSIKKEIISACEQKLKKPHGDVDRWQDGLNQLPNISNPVLTISPKSIHLDGQTSKNNASIIDALKLFCPWRKGPFKFLNIDIKTEWDSLLKWQRILDLNYDFSNKNILDIGCGNGAFMWPLVSANAKSVVGVDPMWLFYHQFMVIQRYVKQKKLCFLPLGIENLPLKNSFDTILSMGVLYHRKFPLDHLFQLKQLIKPNGDLILETIVLPSNDSSLLTPKNRYAGMRNVWMIPSVNVLTDWIIKAGFEITKVSPIIKTTQKEQGQSEWMNFHSLNQFLDDNNSELTIEGLPAPYRVIVLAKHSRF